MTEGRWTAPEKNIRESVARVALAIGSLSLAVVIVLLVTEDYELIVVDDGSTDRTKEVVKCLAPRYPQLQVIHHAQNQGYGAALVTGLKNCQKEFVFFSKELFKLYSQLR